MTQQQNQTPRPEARGIDSEFVDLVLKALRDLSKSDDGIVVLHVIDVSIDEYHDDQQPDVES
jgi:hypothetical protein